MKCDYTELLITLTSDYIKRLSLQHTKKNLLVDKHGKNAFKRISDLSI